MKEVKKDTDVSTTCKNKHLQKHKDMHRYLNTSGTDDDDQRASGLICSLGNKTMDVYSRVHVTQSGFMISLMEAGEYDQHHNNNHLPTCVTRLRTGRHANTNTPNKHTHTHTRK